MKNFSLSFLQLNNIFQSPLFANIKSLNLQKSKFSFFSSKIVYSNIFPSKINLKNTHFSHGLSSAVSLDSVHITGAIFNKSQVFSQPSDNKVIIDNCYFLMIDAQEESPLHFTQQFNEGQVTNCLFAYCSSIEKTGAFHCDATTKLNVSNMCVSNCKTQNSNYATALYLDSVTSCNIRSLCISDCNEDTSNIIYSKKSNTIKLMNISNCKGKNIIIHYGNALGIDYSSFTRIVASRNMIETFASTQKIEHSFFGNNEIANAFIYFDYSVTINHCNITKTKFKYLIVNTRKDVLFNNCMFDFNESSFNGGSTKSCSFGVSFIAEPIIPFDKCLVYSTPGRTPSPSEIIVKQDILPMQIRIALSALIVIVVAFCFYLLIRKVCSMRSTDDTNYMITKIKDVEVDNDNDDEQLIYEP